ncbi:sugar transporter SWEET1 [Cylas formicarius]|uniref:sugar transporter SWEET1 n=1 Tax=Cylas formicarius TaxID=197179 RepID=UPI00295888F1|nr:sugar transporter SWEET1 [Cylas formicarius]
MEVLSQSLQPYKQVIGSVAMYVTIAQFLTGGAICWEIYNKKSSKGYSATPFIGGIAIGILMVKYGYLLSDQITINVNVVAILFNSIWAAIYYQYSENKWEEFGKPTSYAVALVAVFLGYAAVEDPKHLEFRYSFLTTILMLLLLGAPLTGLKEIIEKKDASTIPLPMTFMAALVTFLWLLYGIILNNTFMVVQNVIAFGICVTQLVLIALYPKRINASAHSQHDN